jgi:hypothetical protein
MKQTAKEVIEKDAELAAEIEEAEQRRRAAELITESEKKTQ